MLLFCFVVVLLLINLFFYYSFYPGRCFDVMLIPHLFDVFFLLCHPLFFSIGVKKNITSCFIQYSRLMFHQVLFSKFPCHVLSLQRFSSCSLHSKVSFQRFFLSPVFYSVLYFSPVSSNILPSLNDSFPSSCFPCYLHHFFLFTLVFILFLSGVFVLYSCIWSFSSPFFFFHFLILVSTLVQV